MGRRIGIGVAILATVVTALAGTAAAATGGEPVRGGGVQLDLPAGWAKVAQARGDRDDDPRTLLVIGTDGVQPIASECLVSSYRVPSDGAVVVVIGWKTAVGGASFFPLAGLKLRRGTFECFSGRGAVARVVRRERDYQVNVMVGDRADTATVDAALEAARSIAAAR